MFYNRQIITGTRFKYVESDPQPTTEAAIEGESPRYYQRLRVGPKKLFRYVRAVYTAPSSITVASVSSPSIAEGGTLVFAIALSAASVGNTFAFSVGGTAVADDDYADPLTLSNDVTISGGNFVVPAGVTSFTASTVTVNGTVEDDDKTLTLTVGGVTGTGTILDNDAAPDSNAVELWGNDNVFTKYSANSQGVINLFHGIGYNNNVQYLHPIERVPVDVPNGVTMQMLLFHDKKANGYIRPGTYTITCNKSIPISVGGSGGGYVGSSGVGSCTLTVLPSASGIYNPDTGYGTCFLNGTGATGQTGKWWFTIVHEDDADYHSRGFISTPRWIEQNAHLDGLRYMDALSTNRNFLQTASQLIPEQSCNWDNNSGVDWARYVPLSVIAKRHIELYHVTGKLQQVHINLPVGNFMFNVDAVNATTNKITTISGQPAAANAQHFTDGQPVIVRTYGTMPGGLTEGHYFLKWDGTHLSISASLGGADVDFTTSGSFFLFSNRDPAALHLAMMTELYNVTHTVDSTTYNFRDVLKNQKIEVGNENWQNNSAFKTGYICRTVGSWRETGAFDNELEGIKYFSLKGWKAAQLAGWPDSKIERTVNCQVGNPVRILPILNLVDSAGILSAGTLIKNIPNVSMAVAPYFAAGDVTNQTDMDKIAWVNNGALTQTDAQWRDEWLYGIQRSGVGTKKFTDMARTYKSDIRVISYEAGSHDDFFFSTEEFAGKYAFGLRMNNFLHNTPEGVQIHQAYYDATFVANKIAVYNQYYTHDYYTMPTPRFKSTSSVAIGLGTKTFAYDVALRSFSVNNQLEIFSAANPANAMSGTVIAIDPNVSVTMNITKLSGSGTFNDWTAATTLISSWGMTDNIHRPDNAIMTWWKNLVPYGIDSGLVTAIATPADTAEGGTMSFAVTVTASASTKRLEFSISAENASDIGLVSASNGVTVSGSLVVIPPGVTNFNVLVAISNDTAQEFNESVVLSLDGLTATGTILYNDGAATPDPDYVDVFDLIPSASVTGITMGADRKEVLFSYSAQYQEFYFDMHMPQPNRAGTPVATPEVPINGILRIEFLWRAHVSGLAINTQVFKSAANGTGKVYFTPVSNTTNIAISGSTYGATKTVLRFQNTTGAAIPVGERLSLFLRQNGVTVPINCGIKNVVAYVE